MGSLTKHKDSRFWRAQFYMNGKKVCRSTGEVDKREARKIMEVWEDAGQRKIAGEQARRVLADILGATGRRATVREFAEGWLAERKGEVKPESYSFYDKAVKSWLGIIGPAGAEATIDSVSREGLTAWRTASAAVVSTTTTNHYLKVVRMVLKAAVSAGWLRENPALALRPLKKTEAEAGQQNRRAFTKDELGKVLAAATGEWKGLVMLGIYTGQRLGDLAHRPATDLRDGVLHIPKTKKTGAEIWVPLPADVVALLEAGRVPGSPWLFPRSVARIEEKKGKVNGLSREFSLILQSVGLHKGETWVPRKEAQKALAAAGGVKDRRRVASELSFHSLRHTTRTWLEESGAPVAVIDALIGQDAKTGRTYTHIGKEAVAKAAAGLPGMAELLGSGADGRKKGGAMTNDQ